MFFYTSFFPHYPMYMYIMVAKLCPGYVEVCTGNVQHPVPTVGSVES